MRNKNNCLCSLENPAFPPSRRHPLLSKKNSPSRPQKSKCDVHECHEWPEEEIFIIVLWHRTIARLVIKPSENFRKCLVRPEMKYEHETVSVWVEWTWEDCDINQGCLNTFLAKWAIVIICLGHGKWTNKNGLTWHRRHLSSRPLAAQKHPKLDFLRLESFSLYSTEAASLLCRPQETFWKGYLCSWKLLTNSTLTASFKLPFVEKTFYGFCSYQILSFQPNITWGL